MPTLPARQYPYAYAGYDARIGRGSPGIRGNAWIAAAVLAACACGAYAAEGSALRGLRPPALIDFAPYRTGVSEWQPAMDPTLQTSAQPSALYGLHGRTATRVSQTSGPARLSYSFSDAVTGVLETGPSTQDPYAPQSAMTGQVVRSFASGLGIGLGLRQKQPGDNVFAVAVQQDWGALRGGYTLYSGRSEWSAAAPTHRIQLALDYGNRNSIGLSYTAGRESLPGMLPFATGIDSRDLALSGYHWLAPQWALTYDVVNSELPNYRRQGLRFGIRHTF